MDSLINWFKSWKLLSWRTAIVAVIFIYGLVGFFLVPVVAKKVIVNQIQERTGREATVGEVRCNPFTLSLRVRGCSFPDRPGSVFLPFDEFYANAQVSSLFRWAATLKELWVENPYVGVRRFEDGGINVLELMEDIEERTPPEEEPDEEGGLPRALGEARAEAVRAFLVDGTGAEHARIRIIEPVAVEESEGEDDWVRCRLACISHQLS